MNFCHLVADRFSRCLCRYLWSRYASGSCSGTNVAAASVARTNSVCGFGNAGVGRSRMATNVEAEDCDESDEIEVSGERGLRVFLLYI